MTVPRDSIRKKKRLKVRFGTDYPKRVAFTGDASESGLYIITGQPEGPGTRLLIELLLPDEQQVIAFGRVVWAKKVPPNLIRVANRAGMGIQLLKYESGEEPYRNFLKTLRH